MNESTEILEAKSSAELSAELAEPGRGKWSIIREAIGGSKRDFTLCCAHTRACACWQDISKSSRN